MSCRFEQEVLVSIDRELPFARRVVVEAHLGVCESCARLEAELERVEQLLGSGAEQPLGAVERALAGLQRPRRRRLLPAGLAAAAFLLLALLLPRGPGDRTGEQREQKEEEKPAGALLAAPEPPLAELVRTLDPGAVAARVIRDGVARTAELARLLESRHPERVAQALAVAERAPSPWLAPSLMRLLRQEAFAPRAARLLGSVGSSAAVPALKRALDGPAGVEAREALVAIGGSRAAEVLARRPESAEMLDALVRADARRGARRLAALKDQQAARTVLKRRRGRLLPELRKLARREVAGAVRALGWARDPDALALLEQLSRRPALGTVAARALLALGTPDSVRAAFRAVKRGSARADCFDGVRATESVLLDLLERRSFPDRRTALRLLGRCGGLATVQILARAELPGSLTTGVIETLGAIGSAEAVPVLRALALKGRYLPEISRALANIHDKSSARLLIELLLKRRSEREAARALASMPASVVVPLLLENFRSRHIRRLLASIAGADLGRKLDPWRRWWQSRP